MFLSVLTYAFALWLGLYLLARNLASRRLRYAGLGIVAYALSLATDLLAARAPDAALAGWLLRLHAPLLFLPALFWVGTIVELLPEEDGWRARLHRGWTYGLWPVALLLLFLGLGGTLLRHGTGGAVQPGPAYALLAGALLLPLALALVLALRLYRATRAKKPLGMLLLATLFFGLGAGLLLVPVAWLPRAWLLISIGGDMAMLGVVIAMLDALEEGESLLPDMARAFDGALLAALLFGGLVALTMLATGATFPMLVLLLATLTAAIATQSFADSLQAALDRLSFAAFPRLRRVRADLRTTASALPRINEALELEALSEEEFANLTRRALSHLSDLPRLTTSPLTRLPLVYERLAQRGMEEDTLERAAELQRLLTESIQRLKPREGSDFGTTEAWRHYNALYFPYVVGLRPYSRRAPHDDLPPTDEEALAWFRTYVPERTLHNWQKSAAHLVAQDLWEKHKRQGLGVGNGGC